MIFKEEWINNLPEYLKHDIEMVEKYDRKTSSFYDCYLDELWGSINSCLHNDNLISESQAEELREKYFWVNLDKGAE